MEGKRTVMETDLGFERKKRVLLRGPMLTQSGYGVHSRQVAKWLLSRSDIDLEVQVLPWGDTPWILDESWGSGIVGQLMKKSVDPSGTTYDVTFQVQLPNEWDPKLGKINVGITAGIETDKANPEWVYACNLMDAIFVPSKHAESSLRAAGSITRPIKVVPEAYSESIPLVESPPCGLDFSTPFNFLVFGQITGNNPENDRKNIFYCIKWLCESFSLDSEVGIVLKTNAGRNTCIDRKIVTQTVGSLLKEVRKSAFPKVHLIHGDMSDTEVAGLYKHPKIKALVAPTRGEGYGLPILEAAASGLPVIATGWSGHTDFMSLGKYIELSHKLEVIHQSRIDRKLFVEGSRWARIDEDDFKKKVTKFRGSTSIPRDWAKGLKEKIIKEYSMESIIKIYEESSKGIL